LTEQRLCEQCGKELVKRRGERPSRFYRRRFCSVACSNASKVKVPIERRFCEQCRTKLVRRRGESTPKFQRRVFCSVACSGASKMKGIVSDSALSKRARKYREDKCESCGATHSLSASGRTRPLDVHHIDGDRMNNREENMMTLCVSCHNGLGRGQGAHKPKPRARCRVCGDPARGHGLCNKHYQRWRRRGRPVTEGAG